MKTNIKTENYKLVKVTRLRAYQLYLIGYDIMVCDNGKIWWIGKNDNDNTRFFDGSIHLTYYTNKANELGEMELIERHNNRVISELGYKEVTRLEAYYLYMKGDMVAVLEKNVVVTEQADMWCVERCDYNDFEDDMLDEMIFNENNDLKYYI